MIIIIERMDDFLELSQKCNYKLYDFTMDCVKLYAVDKNNNLLKYTGELRDFELENKLQKLGFVPGKIINGGRQ